MAKAKLIDITLIPAGVREIERLLETLEPKVRRRVLSRSLRAGAKVVREWIRSTYPVVTGRSRRAFKVRAGRRTRKKVVRVLVTSSPTPNNPYTGEAYYIPMVELGHRHGPRRLGTNRPVVRARWYVRRAAVQAESAAQAAAKNTLVAGITSIARGKA
jgi:hypothetical protein